MGWRELFVDAHSLDITEFVLGSKLIEVEINHEYIFFKNFMKIIVPFCKKKLEKFSPLENSKPSK